MKADKEKIARSIKIARGQLDGVLRMIEEDRYCVDISNQILATQAILKRPTRKSSTPTSAAVSGRGCKPMSPTPNWKRPFPCWKN